MENNRPVDEKDNMEKLDLTEMDENNEEEAEIDLKQSTSGKDKQEHRVQPDVQFDLQEGDSPRAPLFVAGRSPRYVNQSPRKGDPGTLIYEATTSASHSPNNVSPRVQLFPGAAASPGTSQTTPFIVGSPGSSNVMMSPLRFGQSPVSMSPPGANQQSLEELMKAAEAATNYKLAHDIATDSEFKLSPRQVDPNSLEGRIKGMMEKAFWDMLRDDIESGEPTYEQAMGLLAEIRETVLDSLLKSQNCAAMAQQFRDRIDLQLIKQQIDTKSFDIYQYSNYIIDVLAKVCAPCRDARIAELRKTRDVVLLFRELMKTLDLMKLDMANFLIEQTRPLIQQHSVEYERDKFQKLLEAQKNEKLQYTKEWLYRARERLIEDPSLANKTPTNPITITTPSPSPLTAGGGGGVSNPGTSVSSGTNGSRPSSSSSGPTGREILHEAFMELLDWTQPMEKYPESCILDVVKFQDLSFEYKSLVMTASLLLVSLNTLGVNDTRQQLVEAIKRNIADILSQSPGLKSPEDVLDGIVSQTVKFLQSDLQLIQSEEKARSLQSQLTQISDSQHAVKKLLQRRIQRYLKTCLDSATHSNPASVPAALVPVQKELSKFTAQFLKVSSYNREVFRPHYTDIIDDFTMTID